jgi:hypothetical protein
MTKLNDLHKEWMKDPEYATAYDALIDAELQQLKPLREVEWGIAKAVRKLRGRPKAQARKYT